MGAPLPFAFLLRHSFSATLLKYFLFFKYHVGDLVDLCAMDAGEC